jgi:hypothetical protein
MLGGAVSAHAQPAPDVIEFSLPTSVLPNQDIVFTVRATNRGDAAASGSISISFPDQPRVSIVDSSPATSNGSYAKVFATGANVFNFSQNKAVPAQYPLAELYLQENWAPGQERYITVRVGAPGGRSTLAIQARVTLRTSAGFFTYPENGASDQQGFPAELRLVSIQTPPAPPTATPVPPPPTPTTRPTLTPTPTPTQTRTPVPASPTPAPSATPVATSPVAAAGVQDGGNPGFRELQPDPPGAQGGTTTILLVGLLLAASVIAVGAVAFTRRPAVRAAPYTQPMGPYPGGSYPPSPPPGPVSFPPATPPIPHQQSGPSSNPLPDGYQIVGPPMHGGMATVYKAYQPKLNRYVALKLLSPTLSGDPTFLHRFQAEARSTARLEHPNIVPIYDMGQANGGIFIVMRFIDGGTLQQLLDRERRLPINRALHITTQVASALDYAHSQGFVHRDVKPANIMIEPGDRATLTDFGVAKAIGETRLTRTGSIVGTPEYLSPEQARGDNVDGRADLYALGIVVYELLAGRTPFQAENPLSVVHQHLVTPPPPPSQFNPAIPAALATVLMKVLAKDPAQRYPTGDSFVQALRHASGGLA